MYVHTKLKTDLASSIKAVGHGRVVAGLVSSLENSSPSFSSGSTEVVVVDLVEDDVVMSDAAEQFSEDK